MGLGREEKGHDLEVREEELRAAFREYRSGRFGVGKRARKSCLPKGEQCNAVLHSKPVHPLDLGRVNALVEGMDWEDGRKERWKFLMGILDDPVKWLGSEVGVKSKKVKGVLSVADAKVLEGHSLIERCEEVKGDNLAFTVFEEKDREEYAPLFGRRRMILWSKTFNALLKERGYKFAQMLPRAGKILGEWDGKVGLEFPCGACRDLTCSFYQIPIPPHSRSFFGFVDAEGNKWQPTRLPMGTRISPEIMQLLMGALAEPPKRLKKSVSLSVYIDNCRWVGQPRDVRACAGLFDWRVGKVGASVSEATKVEDEEHPFLGFVFGKQKVKMGKKTKEKIEKVKLEEEMTYGDIEGLGARLIWGMPIADLQLQQVLSALLRFRLVCNRLNRGWPAETRVRLAAREQEEFRVWREAVFRGRVRSVAGGGEKTTMKTVQLYTDASCSGAGVVLKEAGGDVWSFGKRWSHEEAGEETTRSRRIAVLEAKALLWALRTLRERLRGRKICIFVDNTAVVSAVRKGYSFGSEELMLEVAACAEEIRKLGGATVQYIETKLNPADPWSREKKEV